MRNITTIILLVFVLGISCQNAEKKLKKTTIDENETWIKKTYYEKSGTIKSEITVKNKKKNGPAKEYYPSGKLRTLVNYVDNVTVGETIWYYENGQPYRVTPYKNGKMEGIRKVYYESGKLQAEIPYLNGELIEGTVEYNKNGNKIKSVVNFKFETQNLIKYSNKYLLKISLSNKLQKVKFYQEKTSTEGEKIRYPIPTSSGTGIIEFFIYPGTFKMEVIPIYAEYTSKLGNPYLISTKYNLAIENR